MIPDKCRFCGADLKHLRSINELSVWLAARRQLAFHLTGQCIPSQKEVDQAIEQMEASNIEAQAVRDKWDIARALRPRPRLSPKWKALIIFVVAAIGSIICSYLILKDIHVRGLW